MPIRRLLCAVFVGFALVGCRVTPSLLQHDQPMAQQPSATPLPATETPKPPTATQIKPSATAIPATATPVLPRATPDQAFIEAGIQRTLDRYGKAYSKNDVELLKQTIDGENLPFRRFVVSQFDEYQRSYQGGKYILTYNVDSIQMRDSGFVLAHITTKGGYVTDWLFRQVKGEWLLSEPTPEQLGEPVKTEHEHFTFMTYHWTDDVNEQVMELVEQARKTATERLSKSPTQKAIVEIRPSYGLEKYGDAGYVAYYQGTTSKDGPDYIFIYAPHTYAFGFYDPDTGWQQSLQTILTHEYTHMVHYRSFDDAGSDSEWMSEGLAEYVSEGDSLYDVALAVQNDTIIPIIDKEHPGNPQDLMHMASNLNHDQSLAYGFAYSLVQYIVEKFDGLDSFWKLARAYDKHHDLDKALQEAFHITYDQFDSGWREWLKSQYN